MIKNYLQQLKELHQDRTVFQSQTHKNNLSKTLHKQEDKYQAYIIDQMASQNRIIAASQMASTLGRTLKVFQARLFKALNGFNQNYQNIVQTKSDEMSFDEESCERQGQTIDLMLLKMCLNVIFKAFDKMRSNQIRSSFSLLLSFSKRKSVLQKLTSNTKKYFLRWGLHCLKSCPQKAEGPQNNLFSDSFSMIAMQDRMKKGSSNDQSYLSFMLDKQNANFDCHSCKESYQLALQKEKEASKLKEELSYLKHLLAEKNLEMKKKEEEWEQLKQGLCEDSCQSQFVSKNSSYYSQLERQVLGGKRIRKNGSRSSCSQLPRQQISKQLLGKYMRQSFQLKETMDVAREMVLQIQQALPVNFRGKFKQILGVLNQGQEVSLVDQY